MAQTKCKHPLGFEKSGNKVTCANCGFTTVYSKLTLKQKKKVYEAGQKDGFCFGCGEHANLDEKSLCKACAEKKAQEPEKEQEDAPKFEPEPADLLMFVGREFYTMESFIKEAKRIGVCKRVPMLPRGVVRGKSKLFLAHDLSEMDKHNHNKKAPARIFAYIVINGIAYITGKGKNLKEELAKRGVTEYEYMDGCYGSQDERGCGSLQIGGTYLLGEEDMEKIKDLAESATLNGQINVLKKPVPIETKRFRGYRIVDGNMILNGSAEKDWLKAGKENWKQNKRKIRKYKREMRKLKKEQEEAKKKKASKP